MSSIDFITKPRHEQANYIKEQLETLRRANYDIAKNMEQAQLTERDRQILQNQNEFNMVEQKIIEYLQKFNFQLETLLAIKNCKVFLGKNLPCLSLMSFNPFLTIHLSNALGGGIPFKPLLPPFDLKL